MVGVAPQKLGSTKQLPKKIEKISAKYHISKNGLTQRLNQFLNVDEDSFLPLEPFTGNFLRISGVVVKNVVVRQYNNVRAEAVIGKSSVVSDAELNANHALNTRDRIGRTGYEKKYNKVLSGIDGGELRFISPTGRAFVIRNQVVNGKNVTVS